VDGTIVSFAWNWGDGTPDGSGATATHAYAAAGTWTVTLTVTDGDGATAADTLSVTVTAPPVNLALNRATNVSSTRKGSDYASRKAVDGTTSTSWMSSKTNPAQWLRVDLGSSPTISKVKVFWPATYYAQGFSIETSTNGTSWTQRYSTSSGNGSPTDASFAAVSARYVRVYLTTPNDSTYYGISELEVYQ
jgi:PKD repeat protein